MNRASLLLSYKEQGYQFQKKMESLKIETSDDYVAQMPRFAAHPKFLVQVIPKQTFEYRFEKKKAWNKGHGSKIDWDALDSENLLEVRLVNNMGRPGPVTFIKIQYQ